MKNTAFTGGLSTRLDPHLIGANEAVIYENIDNFKGSLTPVKNKLDTAINVAAYPFFFIANNEWVSNNNERHYVEYNNILYFSETASFPKKYDGTNTFKLGIDTPTAAPDLSIDESAPVTPSNISSSLANGALPKNSLIRYLIVNKSGTGVYSKSLTKTIKTQTGNDTDITLGPVENFETETEIYRLYKGVYRLVGSIVTDTGTLVDNTLDISGNVAAPSTFQQQPIGIYQYVYTFFNSNDGAESGASPISDEITVEDGGQILLDNLEVSTDPQVDQRKIYRIGGNLTSFSLVATIDNTVTSYVDALGDTEIEGDILETLNVSPAPVGAKFLTENNSIFFCAVGRRLFFTDIDTPDLWPKLNFIDFEREITGIGATPNGLLVFDRFKTWIISGTDSSVFTRFVLSKDQGCIKHDAIASISDVLYWPSLDGICASNGGKVIVVTKDKLGKIALNPVNGVVHDEVYYIQEEDNSILALDSRLNLILKRFNLNTERLVVANDVLYGVENGTLHSMFASNDNSELHYKSPKYIEGSVSTLKTYKTIYVKYEGILNIKVFIDGDLAQEADLTGDEQVAEIKVVQDQHKGYDIQYEVTGTGKVYEIETKVFQRQNGR